MELFRAICDYAFEEKEPVFDSSLLKMAWIGIKPTLDKGWRNFRNGLNGGAPVGNKNAAKERETTQKQPKNNPKTKQIEKERRNKKEEIEIKKENDIYINTQEEKKFGTWFCKEYPHLSAMEEPLTLPQFEELEKTHGTDALLSKLGEMENDKKTCDGKRSTYQTLKIWLQR